MDTEHFHPYRSAALYLGNQLLGIFGQIHPQLAKLCDVDQEVIMLEVNLEVLLNSNAGKVKYVPVSKYPSVTRDLAFVVNKEVPVAKIKELIRKAGKQIIRQVDVFDVYTGEHVDADSKSIALSIVFQASEATLTDAQINEIHDKIIASLEKEVGAKLRG